jgi:hypothetical protein
MIDFKFTVLPFASRFTSEVKELTAFTNAVAGLAWTPASLVIVKVFSTILYILLPILPM